MIDDDDDDDDLLTEQEEEADAEPRTTNTDYINDVTKALTQASDKSMSLNGSLARPGQT